MSEEPKRINYNLAKAEADKVDEQIIAALQNGNSFRVEAGAGSGKTYSLNKVIEWIQENKWAEYRRKKQTVICITYTNAAVDVLAERLSKDSFILPSTIHSFAWNTIKQYQRFLIDVVTSDPDFLPDKGDFFEVTGVTYTLGHRYKENGIQYLYHDDVLKLFCRLLDNAKFRRVFADKYPLILIDEYQDSYKPIIDRFISFFIAEKKGPQFGFFGDAWQMIRNHIILSSEPSCLRNILALHEQKLSVRRFGITAEARHQFPLMRLFRIRHISDYVADCFAEFSSFARVQRDKTRGCHVDFTSLFSKK